MMVCGALSGTVDACPTGDVVGMCEQEVSGITLVLTYYGPLPTGVTAESYAMTCAMQDGTWTMP